MCSLETSTKEKSSDRQEGSSHLFEFKPWWPETAFAQPWLTLGTDRSLPTNSIIEVQDETLARPPGVASNHTNLFQQTLFNEWQISGQVAVQVEVCRSALVRNKVLRHCSGSNLQSLQFISLTLWLSFLWGMDLLELSLVLRTDKPQYCRRRKMITYTESFGGKLISSLIACLFADLHIYLLICPRSELISEICTCQCLEHGPTELHIWLSGQLIIRKARNKITQVTA